MPTNNFKLFDQNKANLLSDTEYANATQRLNGVQTGVASSQLNNKFAYQVSLVAYAIAQIMNQNNLDASDTLAVSAFVGNLGAALLQKVADKASSTEAVAGVLNNKYITPATMKAAALLLSGGTMSGPIDMGNHKITGLATPTVDTDATTKGYVDKGTNYSFSLDKLACFAGTIEYENHREGIDFTGKLTSILSAVVCPNDIQTYSWAYIDGLKVSFGTVASTGTFSYIVFGVKFDT